MAEKPDFRTAVVLSKSQITPSMIRVVIGGEGLRDFASCGGLDEFVWLSFPQEGASVEDAPGRYYTIRRWDSVRCEMTVDFVSHDGGIASSWARAARPGQRLGVLKPRFRYVPPADAGWVVLLADATGLPAVGRIIEERPSTVPILAHIEINSPADRQEFVPGQHRTHWHQSFDHAGRPSRLSEIAAELELPEGPGYVWVAGEASEVAACRRHFRYTLGLPKERLTSIGYWIHGQARS